jgi:hypothetical protein
MRKHVSLLGLGLLLVLGHAGCHSETDIADTAAVVPAPLLGLTVQMGHPEGMEPPRAQVGAPGALNHLWQVLEIMSESQSWQEADGRLQALIAGTPPETRYRVEQIGSVAILRSHLLAGNVTTARHEAIGRYVELLIHNRSPEAAVIADAIESVHTIEAETRARWAAVAAQATEERVAQQHGCEGCGIEQVLERVGLGAQHDHALASAAQGVQRLRSLAAAL